LKRTQQNTISGKQKIITYKERRPNCLGGTEKWGPVRKSLKKKSRKGPHRER